MPTQGQEEGDGVGPVRAARPHLSVLEKAQVLSNKASRFSRVYSQLVHFSSQAFIY